MEISGNDNVDASLVLFQCPKCGHSLQQTIGMLKTQSRMHCSGCGVAINIDTNRLSNAVGEIRAAAEKVPSEITIKFF
jgi:transcription elongation factor Elf1